MGGLLSGREGPAVRNTRMDGVFHFSEGYSRELHSTVIVLAILILPATA
jgi:hypothetical protein